MAKKKDAKKTKEDKEAPKPERKLIQVDMAKLSKKGWVYTELYGNGKCIVHQKRLEQWAKDEKRSFDGFEEELKEAMKA